jgi:isoprenylcysteine carboxyl methyltransferase (ICMT) family protein YpbQ
VYYDKENSGKRTLQEQELQMSSVTSKITKPPLPKSPTSVLINLAGVAVWIISVVCVLHYGKNLTTLQAAMVYLAATALPIIILEFIFLRTYKNPSTGLDFSAKHQWDAGRILVKLVGFYATIGMAATVYWLFPEYHRRTNYEPFFDFAKLLLPWLAGAAIPYFIVIDYFMVQPRDGYWQMGMLVLGQWGKIHRQKLSQHILGWLVKIFFLPLMFISTAINVDFVKNYDYATIFDSCARFHHFLYNYFYVVDVLFVTCGYLLTVRLFDSHIQTTEPTFLGWFVALECYEPFWTFSGICYLKYMHSMNWEGWLEGYPTIYMLWGIGILFMVFVYVYAGIPFGIRFSNLTNRGILTNGPYRFCKHPAYVTKNISWWMISIPFMCNGGPGEALRLSLLLLCINIIYLLRARTEERHLSRDPAYVEYATIMNNRSIFAWMGKLLPVFQYRPYKLFNVKDQPTK